MDLDTRSPRWLLALMAAVAVAAGLALAAWSVELPYFALSAGPVGDALEAVEVTDGVDVFPPDGELLMLTVSLQEVNAYEIIAGALDPTVDITARERIRPEDETDEEFRERGLQQMDQSTETAIAVALDWLGLHPAVTSDGVEVVEVMEDAPALGALEAGDVIVGVEGADIIVVQDIGELIADRSPGEKVDLGILRSGEPLTITVELTSSEDEPERPLIGIVARTLNPRFPVTIDSENIGGPSAGMMYTLAVIDQLSEGDLTHGHVVAGTGTIRPDGTVGPVGGIRQKVVAAESAGAQVVLVPAANYPEALTVPVMDLEVVPVATVDEALEYLASLPEM